MRAEQAAADAARDAGREQLRALRDRLRFSRAEDIDAEIAKLEHLISHTSMPLNEEKKLLTQIKELSRSRDEVRLLQEHQLKINESEALRKMISERIKAKDMEISAVKAEQSEARGVLDTFRSKESAELGDIPTMNAEKDKLYQQIKQTRETVQELRTAFKAKEDAWWANEKAWRSQQKDEKQKR